MFENVKIDVDLSNEDPVYAAQVQDYMYTNRVERVANRIQAVAAVITIIIGMIFLIKYFRK